MARREIPREISIYINDRQVVNSFAGISRAITQTRSEINNLNRNSETYNEDLRRLGGELDQLTERQSVFRQELRDSSEAMNDSEGSLKKFRDGLLSGDFESALEGLKGIRSEITNLVKTTLQFIATPIGAAIAVLSGIVVGTKKLFEFNQELEKSNNILRSFGVNSAEELTKVRSEILATAETFDKEFSEIASKANSLSKTYGISMSEANRLISEGLANGGSLNDEFLDSVGEYDEFFNKAGYSASEFIDVINKGYDVGIYSDKLPDALKEADLALKEQTKSTRDALENAFGITFSDNILARVAAGKTTTKEALEEIAAESQKTQLSQQQQAQLTADIFKGAGEDAGGALKILQTISDTTKKEITEATKAQLELLAANEKLNKAQSELFEIEGFGAMWDQVKANAIDTLADIILYVSDLKKDIQPLIDIVSFVLVNAFIQLKFIVVTVFSTLGVALKIFFDYVKYVFDFLKAIITGDFKGAIKLTGDYFVNLGKTILNFFNKIRNTIIDTIKSTIANVAPLLEAMGVDVEKLQKRLDSLKSKEVVLKTTTETKKTTKTAEELAEEERLLKEAIAKQQAIRDKEREKEEEKRRKFLEKKRAEEAKAAKEELDRLLALAKAKSDLYKAELNFFIATQRSKLDSTKKLTPEIIKDETDRLERIKDRKLTALAEERLADIEKAKASAKSAEELVLLKQIIDYNYETERQNLEMSFLDSTTNLKKQYEEEQKVLKAEQLALDNELALAEAANKYEEDRIKQDQDFQTQLARYKKLLEDKKITEEQYIRFSDALKAKQDEVDRQRELGKISASLSAFGQLAGALTELFGQSKALAITQAGINGALAVTSILSAPSMGNPILDAAVKAVQIAAAVLTTTAQIKNISKAKAPKTPKFFYGGFTGANPHLGYDEFGPMTGVVHDNEYVIPKAMTQSPRYANTIAWLENERTGRNTKKFADGGFTSSNVIPPTVMSENDSEMKVLLKAVLFRLENPVPSNVIIGYEEAKGIQDLNEERSEADRNGIVNE
ncbi:hypothetical protein [Flavobacterium panacagri]|uniref:hypothetical protein n=1 Tax=Flavobacterium panacagri TaxID=3034146 RepID=UPI0025A56C2F|nr:hypothetical protein [Flavobacterium panacagri]